MRSDANDGQELFDASEVVDVSRVKGRFCVIDDCVPKACRQAVTDYRMKHGVSAEMVDIDATVGHVCLDTVSR